MSNHRLHVPLSALALLLTTVACTTDDSPLRWPNHAIGYTITSPQDAREFDVEFDERGRQLRQVDVRTDDGWTRTYRGDHRADELVIVAGRPRASYRATFVDELPATATSTELYDGVALTTRTEWNWDTGSSRPFLKSVITRDGLSETTDRYSANLAGFHVESCTDGRCVTYYYTGHSDYIGGPSAWTERTIECPDGSQRVIDQRTFDDHDQLVTWRARGHGVSPTNRCPADPDEWDVDERWERDPDGVLVRYERRDEHGTRVVEYFER